MSSQCRYCPTTIAGTRDVCNFHMKTLRLVRQGRCVWCMRSPDETPFPQGERGSSFCLECLVSRLRQRGDRKRLSNWLSKARVAA